MRTRVCGEERYLDVAKGICNWIVKLPRETVRDRNLLELSGHPPESPFTTPICWERRCWRARRSTAGRRNCSMWPEPPSSTVAPASCPTAPGTTARSPRYHWIDSFHTGYNLDSIKCYIDSTGDRHVQTAPGSRVRGTSRRHFFEPAGRPRYYHDRTYPIDIQCAAQGIETLVKFADDDPEALPTAAEGRAVDDPQHAGSRAATSITEDIPCGRKDPDAPLGAGHDVSGAGVAVAEGSNVKTIGRKSAPACLGPIACWASWCRTGTAPSRPRCSSCSRRAGSRSRTTWSTR